MPETDTPVFEDDTDLPAGRRKADVPPHIWNALEDSAKRGIAKARTMTETDARSLRRQLASAAVRAKYTVRTEAAKVDGGRVRFKFSAESVQPEDGRDQAPGVPARIPARGGKTAK